MRADRDYAANHDIFMRQGAAIQVRRGPIKPRPSFARGAAEWNAVSQAAAPSLRPLAPTRPRRPSSVRTRRWSMSG
jgi:hypothetical protein